MSSADVGPSLPFSLVCETWVEVMRLTACVEAVVKQGLPINLINTDSPEDKPEGPYVLFAYGPALYVNAAVQMFNGFQVEALKFERTLKKKIPEPKYAALEPPPPT